MSPRLIIGLILCHPVFGWFIDKFYKGRIPYRDLIIDVNNSLVTYRTKASLFWGFYEGTEARFIDKFLNKDSDVVELGGSIGVVSALIRRKIKDERRLIIVEGNPLLIDHINVNLKANSKCHNYVIDCALIGYDANLAFVLGEHSTGGRADCVLNDDGQGQQSVAMLGLSELIIRHKVDEFSLVCDIEGGEAGILVNDTKAFHKCRQIMIELHNTEYKGEFFDVRKMIQRIIACGFVLESRHGNVCCFNRVQESL